MSSSVHSSITIARPIEDVFAGLVNLKRMMEVGDL